VDGERPEPVGKRPFGELDAARLAENRGGVAGEAGCVDRRVERAAV
jgi:photosystem II stability/assembly factor-like uncharacterized protein